MNKIYWETFYKHHDIRGPTEFAKWCLPYMSKKLYILDLGCGTGRDSYYFAQNHKRVMGIDYAINPKSNNDARFVQSSVTDIMRKNKCGYDVVYSRFFLHSILYTEVIELLKWSRGLFLAEFRALGDEPRLFRNHTRNFIDGNIFLSHMLYLNFDIIHYEKGRGLAKYKGEDPLIVRVVAQKKG